MSFPPLLHSQPCGASRSRESQGGAGAGTGQGPATFRASPAASQSLCTHLADKVWQPEMGIASRRPEEASWVTADEAGRSEDLT
jgi:hypothetical protein